MKKERKKNLIIIVELYQPSFEKFYTTIFTGMQYKGRGGEEGQCKPDEAVGMILLKFSDIFAILTDYKSPAATPMCHSSINVFVIEKPGYLSNYKTIGVIYDRCYRIWVIGECPP